MKIGSKISNLKEILKRLENFEINVDEWYKKDYFENRQYFDPPIDLNIFAGAILNKSEDGFIYPEFHRLLCFSAEQQQYKGKVNVDSSDSQRLWRLLLKVTGNLHSTEDVFKAFIKQCPFGMGTKTASMCLKFVFLTGSPQKRAVLTPYIPHLFLPIDRVVYKFLVEKLELYEIEDPSTSNAYSRKFDYFFQLQNRLRVDCGRSPRVTLDHLWNVNQKYCKNLHCASCFLKPYCEGKTSCDCNTTTSGGAFMSFNKDALLNEYKRRAIGKYSESTINDNDIKNMNSVLGWCREQGFPADKKSFKAFMDDQENKGNKLNTIRAYEASINRYSKIMGI